MRRIMDFGSALPADKKTELQRVAEKPGTLPELMAVLDYLEAVSIPAWAGRGKTLSEMAIQTCVNEKLPYTSIAVQEAVAEVQKSGITLKPTGGDEVFEPGWRRPRSLEALERQRGENSKWVAFMRRRADDSMQNLLVNSAIFSGIGTIIAAAFYGPHLLPSLCAAVMSAMIGFLLGEHLAEEYIEMRCHKIETGAPKRDMLTVWSKYTSCRKQVRQCLTSNVPFLLKGDIEHIERLLAAERKEFSISIKAEEQRKLDQVMHDMFVKSSKENN